MAKNVMVIGTGTIGEPLIGLLAEHKDALGLDDVVFFKRTPLSDEKGKVEALLRKGAKIVSTSDTLSDFKQLGFPDSDFDGTRFRDDAAIDSLQQIIEIAGLSSIAWMIFGLDESILEEIVFIGINIWGLKKSRDLERDADLIALKLLEKSGMPKKSFILAIEKLTKHYCIETKLEKSVCMSEVKSGWLSTHPTGAERLEYLKENIN